MVTPSKITETTPSRRQKRYHHILWPKLQSTHWRENQPATARHHHTLLSLFIFLFFATTLPSLSKANAPTFLFIPPPLPPFPPDPGSDDLSPLGLVLGFIAIITIPVLIYTVVCGVKCPSLSLCRGGRSSRSYSIEISPVDGGGGGGGSVAFPEANHEKESDDCTADAVGGECPVCLSTLTEGEEIKRLSVCRHAFHTACIDTWLESQSSCPVCRALVPVKRPNNPAPPPLPLPTVAREVFLRQGFQHVVDLV